MRRRTLIGGLGIAALVPLFPRAQTKATPLVGYLSPIPAPDPAHDSMSDGFRQGLRDMGFVDGQNIEIVYRRTNGQLEPLPAMAMELVRLGVAVLVAPGGPAPARAAQAATKTIPIVFGSGDDPVKFGLVPSLNHPGGNATGISPNTLSLDGKRLALLHEAVPNVQEVAVLMNPTAPDAVPHRRDIESAGQALGIKLQIGSASRPDDLAAAFESFARMRAAALFVSADPFLAAQSRSGGPLLALPVQHALPTMYEWRESPAGGGLMSYGTSLFELYRQTGLYTGRILKGERPGDMPVWQPTQFALVINLKTAKALNITLPPTLLARADEVIE